MSKKLILVIITVIALLALICTLIVLDSQNHIHIWDEETITKNPTCTERGETTYKCECGETKTVSTMPHHTWGSASCGEVVKCTNCSETSVNTKSHVLDENKTKCVNCQKPYIKLTLPTLPLEVDEYNTENVLLSTFSITGLSYEVENDALIIKLTGSKSYSITNSEHQRACKVAYKILDSDGFVVASGSLSTVPLSTHDKVRNVEIKSNAVKDWSEYTLIIQNVYESK